MFQGFFLGEKNIQKQAVLWNMIATVASSFQTMLLLMVLTHNEDFVSASIITIGYSVANLSMTVGKYGVRNFQVSDVQEKYKFTTYLYARYITFIFAIVFSVGYGLKGIMFDNYTLNKALCVVLLCVYKCIEAFEDVYHGRLQQMNRLDIAMKILAIRNIVFIIEFVILYCITEDLLLTISVSVVTTFLLAILLNKIPDKKIFFAKSNQEKGNLKKLLIEALPVALAAFLLMYLGNAPKYIMDSVVTDEEQTYFNIIFMVTFAVNLVSTFVFNPFLRKMAVLWDDKKIEDFEKFVTRILLFIAGIVVAGIIFAIIIGRKLLGWIYGVSLEDYKLEVVLMLIAGGMLAILNLMNILLVLIRKQKIIMILCALSSVGLVLFGERVLINYSITGLTVLYLVVLSVLDLGLFVGLKCSIAKSCKRREM